MPTTTNMKKPLKLFNRRFALNPKFAEAYYSLGMSYEALEYYADAVRALKEAMRLNPKLPDIQLNLGLLLSKAGHHQEAITMLRTIRARQRFSELLLHDWYGCAQIRQHHTRCD
jgi:tetratricopeptide (TPR) repeat protein